MIPVLFKNISTSPCAMSGYPRVGFVDASGQPVGHSVAEKPAGIDIRSITLSPGTAAVARLWEVTQAAATADVGCTPVTASAIKVVAPVQATVAGSAGAWSKAVQVCTSGAGPPFITPLIPNP
jgi:hypothetical protein